MANTVQSNDGKQKGLWVVDGRVKIIALFAFSLALFFIDGVAGLALALAVLVGVACLGKVSLPRAVRAMTPAYPLIVFVFIFHVASTEWEAALVSCLRLLVLLWASAVLYLGSSQVQLTWALQCFLKPLRRLGVPVRDISTALSVALRFIPLMGQELKRATAAQLARGARLEGCGAAQSVISHARLMVPLFVGLFRRGDALACALDARCFGAHCEATSLNERPFACGEWRQTAICLAVCLALALVF